MRKHPDIESRTIDRTVEVRGRGGTGSRTVGGYGALFNSRSEVLGSFREIVSPKFFNKSKSDGWVGCVANF
jgi:uncharacterized protein